MKKNFHKKRFAGGLSLIEILVVVTIFAILGVIVSSSLMLTLRGAKKSESLIKVRENLNYSLAVIERNLRSAETISDCTNSDTKKITYLDQNKISTSFFCVNTGAANSYIASGSAIPTSVKLTSDSIKIVSCSFTCAHPDLSNPPSITIDLTVQDASGTGIESSVVSAKSQIYLRNY